MATLINNEFFSFTGKLGNVVGYKRNGRYYVRSLPKKSTKAPSQGQLATRSKLMLATAHLGPIKNVLKQGFIESRKRNVNYYNLAIKAFLTGPIDGTYPAFSVNYSKMQLSNGSLGGLSRVTMRYYKQLLLHWRDVSNECNSFSDDQVIVVNYNVTTKIYTVDDNTTRADSLVGIEIALDLGDFVHVWVFCVKRDGKKVSTSQYVGSVKV